MPHEAMGEETSEVLLPLGFTGPLQPLKRHAVLRSFQDDSEATSRRHAETSWGEGVPVFLAPICFSQGLEKLESERGES